MDLKKIGKLRVFRAAFWILGLISIPLGLLLVNSLVFSLTSVFTADMLTGYYGWMIILSTAVLGFIIFGGILYLVRVFIPTFPIKRRLKKRKIPKVMATVSMIAIILSNLTLSGVFVFNEIKYGAYLKDQSKKPYVLWAAESNSTVRICWETKDALTTTLAWGLTNTSLTNHISNSVSTFHLVDINNLSPDTRYYYNVGGFEEVFTFKTAPSNPTIFRFMKVGDSQYNVGRLNGDIMGSGSEEVVAHIRANYESATGPEFDFFVTSGDQVELGKLDHYKRYFSDWEWAMNAGIPWVAAPGNHETYYDDDLENYYRYFNYTGSRSMEGHPENFWVEYGNMLIVNIFLSTSGMYLYESDPRADVFTWVEAILSEKADDYDWVVLNQHHPVYMSSWYPSEDNPFGYDPILIEEELPLIETYGVDLVLMGHWHAYERLIKGNTTFMVTGGGGGGLDGWGTPQTLSDGSDNAESLVFEPTKHSYSVFDVNELQMNIITWATDGTLVDNTTIFAS